MTIAFKDSGFYIMRTERIYLLAACQPIGVSRYGPHKHNDWLSFELCIDRSPIVIDPGTYCYTADKKKRNLFRSTGYHNTVVLDGEEQISIEKSLFGLEKPFGDIKILKWEDEESQVLLEAEHTGYSNLNSPVVHRRIFKLNKHNHSVELNDRFLTHGTHMVEWYFHLDTNVHCKIEGKEVDVFVDESAILRIISPKLCELPMIKTGWVSKKYNNREKGEILYLLFRGRLTPDISFVHHFNPLPKSL